jgi:hypothetical protein
MIRLIAAGSAALVSLGLIACGGGSGHPSTASSQITGLRPCRYEAIRLSVGQGVSCNDGRQVAVFHGAQLRRNVGQPTRIQGFSCTGQTVPPQVMLQVKCRAGSRRLTFVVP